MLRTIACALALVSAHAAIALAAGLLSDSSPLSYRDVPLANGVRLSVLFGGAPLGSAPALLFLHGFPEGSASWAPLFASGALDAFTLIAPDLRGYNKSSLTGPGGHTISALASDVIQLAQALRVPRFHLAAHDWGGAVAWFVAAGHPEALLSLTIVNMAHPMGWIKAVRTDATQQQASSYVLSFVNPAFTAIAVADDYALLRSIYAPEPWWTPGVADAYVRSWRVPGTVDAALNYYRENIHPHCALTCTVASCWQQGANSTFDSMPSDGVTPPTLPVRVLWGMRDTAFDDVYQLAYMATKVRGTLNVTRFPANGHWLAQEAPEAVAVAIADFVQAAEAGAAAPATGTSATYTPVGGSLNASDWSGWLSVQAGAGVTTLILAPGAYTVAYVPGARAHIVFPPLSGVSLVCTGVSLTILSRTEGALAVSGWTFVALLGLTVHYAVPPSNRCGMRKSARRFTHRCAFTAVCLHPPLPAPAARALQRCTRRRLRSTSLWRRACPWTTGLR